MSNPRFFRGHVPGEIAVIGLGKSGRAVAELLARDGHLVYASDAGASEAALNAAEALRALGVDVQTGGHDLMRIGRAALVVASPGVPPDAPPIAAARAAAVPVVGEIEIALSYLPGLRYVAVTGTNGKTTTTALVAHLLRAVGATAIEAGNIGLPLAEVALMKERPEWVALELSSFQLHDTPSVKPTVGVLTNLSPDHLDRYASETEYYADKARLFANADAASRWVVNGDDETACAMTRRVAGETSYFAVRQVVDADAALVRHGTGEPDALWLEDAELMSRDEVPLLGDHNVANVLAAALALRVAFRAVGMDAPPREKLAAGVRTFQSLPHRMERVGTFGGVEWINDSKATNVSSTLVAVQGMTTPYVLLLGGRHKGEPYTSLAEPFRKRGRAVIAYGESAALVERDLAGLVPVERMGTDFAATVKRAGELAGPGGAVLLSPACSSYDMFDNYEQRGAEFRRLAAEFGGSGA
jgi:UDP-N-acetylmuramoylalanine--D-glutamate ligase